MRKNGDAKRTKGILTCIALLCMLLVLFATFGVEQAYAADDVQYVGDVDGDGEITPKDVTMLRRYLAKGWNVDAVVEDADVDSDGDITPKDVTMLRRYLAKGWGVELPEKEINNDISAKIFFYSQLNSFEKNIYENIKKLNWDNNELKIQNTEGYSFEQISDMCCRAFTALTSDEPRYKYYWLRSWSVADEAGQIRLVLDKNSTVSEYLIGKADEIAKNIVNSIPKGTDRYTAIREITTYIKVNTEYDPYYPFSSNVVGMYNDTALGVFLKNSAVCAGYADATKILFDMLDIPCIIVGNAGHAWNYIQMEDGNWYALDMSGTTYLDGFDDKLRDDFILNNTFLCGSSDYGYASESNYHLSDMYLGNPGDFSFPDISENNYSYKNDYNNNMNTVPRYIDKAGEFIYLINEDGQTCTIIAYEGEETGDLIIPSTLGGYTVTIIGDGACYRLEGFTGDLVIPDTVVKIEAGAFKSCANLSGKLILSNNLEVISENAFVGNKKLSGTLNLPASLKMIGRCAFYDCQSFSGDLIIPENVKELEGCFCGCIGFNGKVIIPSGVENWDSTAISNTHFKEFDVSKDNEYLTSVDGVLYTKDLKTLIACPTDKEGSLIIPDSVTEIKTYSCFECCKINRIELPESLMIIGDRAFEGCTGITGSLSLPDMLKVIGWRAFWVAPTYDDSHNGFSGDLIIPDSVTEIGLSAFHGNYFGGKIKLSSNLTEINDETFMWCKFTGDLVIPENVKKIGAHAFDSQSNDNPTFIDGGKLILSEGIEEIGMCAFMGAGLTGTVNLTGVNVGENAFMGNNLTIIE